MKDLISRIERKTIGYSAYESYKFFKDLALVYMGNHGYDLAFQYADKSKHEREKMAIDAMELPAKQVDESPWIPVTPETMPEPGMKVLARLKFFASETVRHYELIRVNEDDCNWRTVDDGSEIAYEWNVTHYMPIPALPEQGVSDE